MKNILIYFYIACVLITIVASLIFASFNVYTALFCIGSLLVSLALSVATAAANIESVYKIGLLIGISIVAIISYIISMFIPHYTSGNLALFAVLTLIAVEVLAVGGAKYFSKFA